MPSILPTFVLPDHSIKISIDRGGSFADTLASYPTASGERKEVVVKLLSVDPANYADAPTEACRRVLEFATGTKIPRGQKLDVRKIDYIRLSTTVATNALLERKGAAHAFVVTKGFRDLLRINNQSRPSIFALNVRRPSVLYNEVLEVDERVTLVGYSYDPEAAKNAVRFDEAGKVVSDHEGDIVRGVSGEPVRIMRKPDLDKVRSDLQALYNRGIRSLAICFVHSFTFPDHERAVAAVAEEIGFTQISVSSTLSPQIKAVPRATSASVDAYLNPILVSYLSGFFKGFDDSLGTSATRVEFMTSEGTLVDVNNFSGLRSILSGPAGGVVGYALTSWDDKKRIPIIAVDVGGTSADVSRFDGTFEKTYETTTAGVSIQVPQLDINTVAAGGGSCLTFRNGLFYAGPESVGADPGPACYRKGGGLSITDANLVLGRIFPDYFPKIFGKTEDLPLSVEASVKAMEALRAEINAYSLEHPTGSGKAMSLDEVAYGFVKIVNETMARPVRALTEARGFSTSKHILAAFGGAGGQHACELARTLGITQILIHKYSSILSAYGMALADRAFDRSEPFAAAFTEETKSSFVARLERLKKEVVEELRRQGFEDNRIEIELYLNMRYDGSDTTLMTLAPADGSHDFATAFETAYKNEFGFLLDSKAIMVDDVRVRGIGKTFDSLGESVLSEADRTVFSTEGVEGKAEPQRASMYFEQTGRVDVPVYKLDNLAKGDKVLGPGAIVDGTQTLILEPGAEAKICSRHVYITLT